MQIRNKYLKLLGTLAIASSAIFLNSCTPVMPPSVKTIDPRLVGTWAGKDGWETSILVLDPSGKGKAFTRKRGKFAQGNLVWNTRSGILELRRSSWLANFPIKVEVGRNVSRNNRNQEQPVSVIRGSLTQIREKKFTMRDVRNPSDVQSFYRYSPKPVYYPFPVYAWIDNGNHKVIDKPKN